MRGRQRSARSAKVGQAAPPTAVVLRFTGPNRWGEYFALTRGGWCKFRQMRCWGLLGKLRSIDAAPAGARRDECEAYRVPLIEELRQRLGFIGALTPEEIEAVIVRAEGRSGACRHNKGEPFTPGAMHQ